MTGEVGLPAIDHGGLRRVERGLGRGVVHAGFLQRADGHLVADGRVAHDAFAATGMLGMREPGRGKRDVGVASFAALARHRRRLVAGERIVSGHVRGDLFESDHLVLHARDGPHVHVALDARDVLVRALRPSIMEGAHLVAGRPTEGRLVGRTGDSREGDARHDERHRDCGDQPNGHAALSRS